MRNANNIEEATKLFEENSDPVTCHKEGADPVTAASLADAEGFFGTAEQSNTADAPVQEMKKATSLEEALEHFNHVSSDPILVTKEGGEEKQVTNQAEAEEYFAA